MMTKLRQMVLWCRPLVSRYHQLCADAKLPEFFKFTLDLDTKSLGPYTLLETLCSTCMGDRMNKQQMYASSHNNLSILMTSKHKKAAAAYARVGRAAQRKTIPLLSSSPGPAAEFDFNSSPDPNSHRLRVRFRLQIHRQQRPPVINFPLRTSGRKNTIDRNVFCAWRSQLEVCNKILKIAFGKTNIQAQA